MNILPDTLAHAAIQTGDAPFDYAASLAFFLLEKTGSIYGVWRGTMRAVDQRKLFGRFLGKGKVIIDGANETLIHRVKVCFGHDYDDTVSMRWAQL
ncbi:hypothetical protein [Burkholderia aenigmatica]|uniref:hypothetical protein n=1 Tax=Burkholderia aenigmatica TaxID=2015348 RepID=UPI00264E7038|nr:hypothetical protein [Burkholderia aenigmatica]MDN7880089.1 hypothetical protein [Burkholderia aenigmatica]